MVGSKKTARLSSEEEEEQSNEGSVEHQHPLQVDEEEQHIDMEGTSVNTLRVEMDSKSVSRLQLCGASGDTPTTTTAYSPPTNTSWTLRPSSCATQLK